MHASTIDPQIVEIARSIREVGGHALVVGGWVRDLLLGRESKDVDIEVFGISAATLEQLLRGRGAVTTIGRSFGVFKVHGLDVDLSLPRKDSKVEAGHRGFQVLVDPDLSFGEAARRRDLPGSATLAPAPRPGSAPLELHPISDSDPSGVRTTPCDHGSPKPESQRGHLMLGGVTC